MSNFAAWWNEKVVGYAFKDLFRLPWYLYLVIGLLLLLGIVLLLSGRKERWGARQLASAAMCIAISYVLSCIRLFRMPLGGSIVPFSILPIVAFSVAAGFAKGSVVAVLYGGLQLITGWILNPVQAILEYIVAYWMLGLGGLVAAKIKGIWKLPTAIVITGALRYLVHVVAAFAFYADTVPGDWVGSAALYFFAYNLFLVPEIAASAAVSFLPPVRRIVERMKIR